MNDEMIIAVKEFYFKIHYSFFQYSNISNFHLFSAINRESNDRKSVPLGEKKQPEELFYFFTS